MGRYSYKQALDILWNWSVGEGFTGIDLTYSGISQIDWEKNTLNTPNEIKIQDVSYEEQTYLFLHELGHHQLRKCWTKFNKLLPTLAMAEEVLYYKRDRRLLRRKSYIVSELEEEYKAWEEGMILGKKLGIKISEKKWSEIKSKCLMSYIRYFASVKL